MKRGNRTHKSDRPPEINITYADCERRACSPGKTGKRSLKRKKTLGLTSSSSTSVSSVSYAATMFHVERPTYRPGKGVPCPNCRNRA